MREERRPKLSESRVLRNVLGRKRDEVTGDWKKCHSKELDDLQKSQNIIRELKMKTNAIGGACGMHGMRRSSYRIWGGGGNLRERDHLGVLGVDESCYNESERNCLLGCRLDYSA